MRHNATCTPNPATVVTKHLEIFQNLNQTPGICSSSFYSIYSLKSPQAICTIRRLTHYTHKWARAILSHCRVALDERQIHEARSQDKSEKCQFVKCVQLDISSSSFSNHNFSPQLQSRIIFCCAHPQGADLLEVSH